MHVTSPDGRRYEVSRRWSLPRGWLVQVRDLDAPLENGTAPVVMAEQARGWAAARAHEKSLAGLIATRQVAPPRPGHLSIRRQSVAMGDDATDNTLFAPLSAGVPLSDLMVWFRERGPFVSAGARHTWLLREDAEDGKAVRALAVLDLRTPRTGDRELHVHLVADPDHRVAVGTSLRLEYLLTQDVQETLDLIAQHPRGPYRLR